MCLTIGLNIGKSMATFSKNLFIGINHLEGRIKPRFRNKYKISLLIIVNIRRSHPILIVRDVNKYEQLGTTNDDALGEAFDKTAKMLDLGYPGGPSVEKFSCFGDKNF